jgi:hypothetical protein
MPLASRHPIPVFVAIAALVATAIVFVGARPESDSQRGSTMIDFSTEHYYSPNIVRAIFASRRIKLYAGEQPAPGTFALSGDPRFFADALQVQVGPRTGTGSWGPKLEPYEERFGNVLVTYGGHDEQLLGRIRAAVNDLRVIP